MKSLSGETLKAHAAMLLFAFLVSTSFTVGRSITFLLDPGPLTFMRFVMAVAIFSLVALLSKERFSWPTVANWLRYFFLALLLVIFFVTMFEGLRWSTPLASGAVFTLVPFMTAIIGFAIFRQSMALAGFLALVVAGLASLWIMFGGNLAAIMSLQLGRGEAIFLVGCAAYAGYAPAVKKFNTGSLVYMTFWTLVAGTILLLIFQWPNITSTKWHLASSLTYLAIAWLALFTTAITFYLINYAALRLPSVKVMSYTLLIPAFILLQRVVNGGIWPSASVLAALAVLFGSMLVLQRV
ncbi:hypothetical protein MNBD_ALPHA08-1056 [hydrothermal vent metagenome]|uniref:EamA domain-containing protein n=1 Tax=hydrothermal vent metagenome TaxID=652676 RepID=A0A3B0RI66_9ZZZZ